MSQWRRTHLWGNWCRSKCYMVIKMWAMSIFFNVRSMSILCFPKTHYISSARRAEDWEHPMCVLGTVNSLGRGLGLTINLSPALSTVPGTEQPTKVCLLHLTKMRYLKCFLPSPWKKEIETIQGNTLWFFCPSFVGVGLIFLADHKRLHSWGNIWQK